ncbi:hypothetical protein V6N13_065345 [Hibiscus sabdariffa]|uniref:Uncharacterized protein n=1 Tax=Hibiscus sabdariffa TaxID=183260 RepID=A0ABR2QR55_9ROSI
MAHQDLIVALVFMAIIGAFAANSSPSPATPKASAPSKSPSSSSSSSSSSPSFDTPLVTPPKSGDGETKLSSSEVPKSSSSSTPTIINKSNSPSFSSSNSEGGAPNSFPSGAPPSNSSSLGPTKSNNHKTKKGSSPDSESPEKVSFPPLPTTINELFDSLSPNPKIKDVDDKSLEYSKDSPTPASSNVNVV